MTNDKRPQNQPDDVDAQGNPFADLQSEVESISLNATLRDYDDAVELPDQVAPGRDADPLAPAAAALPGGPIGEPVVERLCPTCSAVRKIKGGRCSSCGYVFPLGAAQSAGAARSEDHSHPAYAQPEFDDGAGGTRTGIFALIAVLVLGLGAAVWFFVVPLLRSDPAPVEAVAPGEGTIASVQTVNLDDAFRERAAAAFQQANANLETAGIDGYVYRLNLVELSIPGQSQDIVFNAYVGGSEAAQVRAETGQELVRAAVGELLDELSARQNVRAYMELHPATEELPDSRDIYLVYGYHYGRENWDEIGTVVDAIEAHKQLEGQYPLKIGPTLVTGLRTKGNPNFMARGFGYIPLFRTDSAGTVVMGTGSGLAGLSPAEVTGYYLLAFTDAPPKGLDFYSPADLNYYLQRISPYPYAATQPVKNMPLTPDGEPDGIGALVHNGKLVER